MPHRNTEAPDFTLQSFYKAAVGEVTLSSFYGRRVGLFFLPPMDLNLKDLIPLGNLIDDLNAMNVEIIAITTEPLYSLEIFMEEITNGGLIYEDLNVRWASDPDENVGQLYGIQYGIEDPKVLVLLDEDQQIILTEEFYWSVSICDLLYKKEMLTFQCNFEDIWSELRRRRQGLVGDDSEEEECER